MIRRLKGYDSSISITGKLLDEARELLPSDAFFIDDIRDLITTSIASHEALPGFDKSVISHSTGRTLDRLLSQYAHDNAEKRVHSKLISLLGAEAQAVLPKVSSVEEMYGDWHQGEITFALDVFRGNIDVVRDLDMNGYDILEKVWFNEIVERSA